MMEFQITGEKEKARFANVLDWQQHYRPLKCAEHQKGARLNLLVNQSGSNVSINACCRNFFLSLVDENGKFPLRRPNRNN